jgi:hypothetical protein
VAKPATTRKTASFPPRYAQVLALLSAASGATISEISAACGWQRHSTRGTLSTGRSRFGWQVEKVPNDERGTIYAIVASTTAPRANAAASKQLPAVKPCNAVKPDAQQVV